MRIRQGPGHVRLRNGRGAPGEAGRPATSPPSCRHSTATDLAVRRFDRSRLDAEIRTFLDIYNRALDGTWGFTPLQPGEVKHIAAEMGQIIAPEFAAFAMVDGEAVGVVLALLDYNQIIRKLDGRLLPFGIFRLMWGRKRINVARTMAMTMVPGVPAIRARHRAARSPRRGRQALGTQDLGIFVGARKQRQFARNARAGRHEADQDLSHLRPVVVGAHRLLAVATTRPGHRWADRGATRACSKPVRVAVPLRGFAKAVGERSRGLPAQLLPCFRRRARPRAGEDLADLVPADPACAPADARRDIARQTDCPHQPGRADAGCEAAAFRGHARSRCRVRSSTRLRRRRSTCRVPARGERAARPSPRPGSGTGRDPSRQRAKGGCSPAPPTTCRPERAIGRKTSNMPRSPAPNTTLGRTIVMGIRSAYRMATCSPASLLRP